MQYDFSLAAGAAQSFDVVGTFVKYQTGTGLIRVRMSMGEYVDLLPGQGVFSVNYTRFTVTDRSGANNVGALLAGDFDFRDSRITGDVTVIDNSKNNVMSGSNFVSNRSIVGVAANYLMLQIFNPAGSGKRVAINGLSITSTLGATISMGLSLADIAGDTRNGWNKRSGGASSATRINALYDTTMTFAAAGAITSYGGFLMTAGVTMPIPIKQPIILFEGQGIVFVNGTVASGTSLFADFEEF
jgi:hypothetical protein